MLELMRRARPAGDGSEDAGCAYHLSEDCEMRVCGATRQPRSSYCPQHHALCHIACGTGAEADCLREVEMLARAAGGRRGWRGTEPSRHFLERMKKAMRNLA